MSEYVKHSGGSHAGKSKKPYDAMVYKDADSGYTIAVDGNGNVIKKVLSSANTDDVVINSVAKSNYTVIIDDGTYNMSNTVNFSGITNFKLLGCGIQHTILDMNGVKLNFLNSSYIELSNFSISNDGALFFRVSGNGTISNIYIHDVYISGLNTNQASYHFGGHGTIDSLTVERCTAYDVGGFGFLLDHMGDPVTVFKNTRIIDCEAIKCGYTTRYNDWCCGFDIAEGCELYNVEVSRCHADSCWENGFHSESNYIRDSVIFESCISESNGVKPAATYGSGFIITNGIKMYGCISKNNAKYGIRVGCYNFVGYTNTSFVDAETYGNTSGGCHILTCSNGAKNLYINLISSNEPTSLSCSGTTTTKIENIYIYLESKNCSYSFYNYGTNIYNMDLKLKSISCGTPFTNTNNSAPNYGNIYNSKIYMSIINSTNAASAVVTGDYLGTQIINSVISIDYYNNTTLTTNGVLLCDLKDCCVCVKSKVESTALNSYVVDIRGTRNGVNGKSTYELEIIGGKARCTTTEGICYVSKLIAKDNVTGDPVLYEFAGTVNGTVVLNGYGLYKNNFTGVWINGANPEYIKYTIYSSSSSITAGNTYVNVTHGLASTPTTVRVTPTSNLGTRSFWVDTKGATTFRININSSDVIDHTFDWEAEV